VHYTAEERTDYARTKHSFYQEVERVFNKFIGYHAKVISGDFNARIEREIFGNIQECDYQEHNLSACQYL
jgi:hypothetical protein